MCGNAPILQIQEAQAGTGDLASRGITGELIPLQETPVSFPAAKCLDPWSEILFFLLLTLSIVTATC